MSSSLFALLLDLRDKAPVLFSFSHCPKPPNARGAILYSAIIGTLWLPYLLAYWPGFVLSDTVWSLTQALGIDPWNNHHPVAYSFFIKCCIDLSNFLGGGTTEGCAIYCGIQMTFLALSFGCVFAWIVGRLGISCMWGIALAVLFGGSPYIATYSIAMWKDPIFSACIMLASALLGDLVITPFSSTRSQLKWLLSFGIILTISILTRSNGLYVCIFVIFILLLCSLKRGMSKTRRLVRLRAVCAAGIALAVSLAITGPFYSFLQVEETPKAESYGMFINQMARVAALDGNMSDEDREFMNELLPIDLYKDAYTPTKVDRIKWHPSFNKERLEDNFFTHWLSMLVKNPRLYFEAWELETFGFWTVNVPAASETRVNIAGGGQPLNTTSDSAYIAKGERLGLHFQNLLGSKSARKLFIQDEWSLPLGWIFWGLALLSCYLIALRKQSLLVPLAPATGIFISLIAASPMYYWARYGAAEHFLVPFFIALLIFALKRCASQAE